MKLMGEHDAALWRSPVEVAGPVTMLLSRPGHQSRTTTLVRSGGFPGPGTRSWDAMHFERATDEDLLLAQAAGDAGPAFAAFYRRHGRLVMAYFVRRVREPQLAADLTAETFAQALASRHRFESRGPGSAARWLFAIASHVRSTHARERVRDERRRAALELEPPPLSPNELAAIVDAGREQSVLDALDRLPEDQRAAIRAYVLEEQSYRDIAGTDGLSEAVVRKRVSRGLAALRRDLGTGR